MFFLLRRVLAPLALIAVSATALLLVLDSALPGSAHHSSAVLRPGHGVLAAATLALQIAGWSCAALLSLTGIVLAARLRARRRRGEDLLCAELCLGRDDQASPYELSKLLDGMAGALRPSAWRRAL